MNDPMELIIAEALTRAGITFLTERQTAAELDFYLPAFDVHIEVKRFHTPRIADQMGRAPNVIAVQGERAVRWLASLIGKGLFSYA